MFVGFHCMLADATRTPELAMGMEEGDAFMKSAQNVMRHYSVESTQKTLDWIAFAGMVGGQMYGPRAVAIAMRRREEKKSSREGNVLRPQAFQGGRQAPAQQPEVAPLIVPNIEPGE